ncbi:hypothetical protein [Alienimonas chondri]|uniref:Uncharacterized protein n=1 Tax=Alienimonas chondri TaxID=2681879 RepID=A0ABX1VHI5_9PLAN|nr:hypothetical protein [Alienimonas chondri]NNJ27569.1 hypothetical protein [Alienimonas chondri]
MTIHTGTLRGGMIELDDAPDLPDGRRVRVTVEPAEAASHYPVAASDPLDADGIDAFPSESRRLRGHLDEPVAPRPPRDPAGFARVAGLLRGRSEEVDAFVEETYRLRRSGRDG